MIQFEGDRDLAAAPAEASARLSDARFLVQCIPGAEAVAKAEPAEAVCTIRPGFAFVRGTLELTLRVAEAVPEKSVRIDLLSKGIGTSSAVEAVLTFAAHEAGSRVHWVARVKELGGLLKAVPKGLVTAAAQKVLADAWAAVEARLKAPAAP
jgi:carbon monoxide dehydrogenase subunit G